MSNYLPVDYADSRSRLPLSQIFLSGNAVEEFTLYDPSGLRILYEGSTVSLPTSGTPTSVRDLLIAAYGAAVYDEFVRSGQDVFALKCPVVAGSHIFVYLGWHPPLAEMEPDLSATRGQPLYIGPSNIMQAEEAGATAYDTTVGPLTAVSAAWTRVPGNAGSGEWRNNPLRIGVRILAENPPGLDVALLQTNPLLAPPDPGAVIYYHDIVLPKTEVGPVDVAAPADLDVWVRSRLPNLVSVTFRASSIIVRKV